MLSIQERAAHHSNVAILRRPTQAYAKEGSVWKNKCLGNVAPINYPAVQSEPFRTSLLTFECAPSPLPRSEHTQETNDENALVRNIDVRNISKC